MALDQAGGALWIGVKAKWESYKKQMKSSLLRTDEIVSKSRACTVGADGLSTGRRRVVFEMSGDSVIG